MPTIKLARGKETAVSEEDFEYLNQWKWSSVSGYISRQGKRPPPPAKRPRIYMHRAVMERMLGDSIPAGYEIDHINGDRANNKRENLRLATRSQNAANTRNYKGLSPYKGVSWFAPRGYWRATIRLNGKQRTLGYYDTEEKAARAHDAKARELHGAFAWLNFPDEDS